MAPIDPNQQFASLADLLRVEVSAHPERTAIQFLGDGESVTESATYAELDARARRVACWLSSRVSPRSRVLLSFNPGLNFVNAFLGCIYAGVTAVPVYPPRRRGNLDRLEAIAINSRASLVLSTIKLQDENSSLIHLITLSPVRCVISKRFRGGLIIGEHLKFVDRIWPFYNTPLVLLECPKAYRSRIRISCTTSK